MHEQTLNVGAFLRNLRRQRVLLAVFVLLGLLCGAGLVVYQPPLPSARTLVILSPTAETPQGTPERDTETEIIIATSLPVVAAAGEAVTPAVSPQVLRGELVVTALSADVLQIQVTNASAQRAVALANAIATDYIAYLNSTASSSNDVVLTTLKQEASQLTSQILLLQQQINAATARLAAEGASTAAGLRDTALLDALRAEQDEVSLQLNNINSQIVTAELSDSASASTTQVLQKAQLVPPSEVLAPTIVGIGGLAGLIVGCLVIFFRSRRDPRLRLRDDFAAAIGLPVLASMDADRCRSASDWARALRRYRPSPVDVWSVRRLVNRLALGASDKRLELNVLAYADDPRALVASVQLPRTTAELGLETTLFLTDHPSLVPLRTAFSLRHDGVSQPGAITYEPRKDSNEFSGTELVVQLTVLDRVPHLTPVGSPCVLAVSSGYPTAEDLARVALAVSESGNALEGVLLVNPDPDDATTGMPPEVANQRRHGQRRSFQRVLDPVSGQGR
ncbi:MAG TPA: hypothetical protein VEJ84_03640 [Acidimicrobiales bacterium]|nr:hypothetical protein [Acidimicrobiales bacterium]